MRRSQLARMKRWALVLLLMMVAGFVTSHLMGGQGVWAWVRAFCEAATVGALADWFAVVALFRRPLGLPIPHTAIIPNSKDRIGENLAVFVRDHFLDPDSLLERLRVFDPTARILVSGVWLGNAICGRLLNTVPIDCLLMGGNLLSAISVLPLLVCVLGGVMNTTLTMGLMFVFCVGAGACSP
ncbi:DUF445 family protein, partial [Bordetella holmesii]|uniref:DUF445 family protein n=1 Tax=Bordetella holmesii TaxID=35814 RepID=UPI0005180EC8